MRVVFTPVVPASGSSNQWQAAFYDEATSSTVPVAEIDLEFDDSRTGRGGLLAVTPVGALPYDATTGIATVTVADGPIDEILRRYAEDRELEGHPGWRGERKKARRERRRRKREARRLVAAGAVVGADDIDDDDADDGLTDSPRPVQP